MNTVDPAIVEQSMRRAFELARGGPERGVNPQVGCVILDPAGNVIAEGWHRGVGTDHAEVDALKKLSADQARGATAVVSLEPCNHFGHTGPCALALIEAGIASVYYSVSDPGVESARGASRLREAGVEVSGGVLESQGANLIHDWLRAARLGRPFVSVKWASSLDGRAAAADGSSQWITGTAAREDVHERRAQHDAIAVGTGTVIADNPSLTARAPDGSAHLNQPVPIVFGTRTIDASAQLSAPERGTKFFAGTDLHADLDALYRDGIRSVFVEGGPRLASSFIRAGLADELLIYLAPALLGGPQLALTDVGVDTIDDALRLRFDTLLPLGDDLLITAQLISATEGN